MLKKPLDGMKVVEMSTVVAVPASARILAENGAQVIKVEAISGDPARWSAPGEWRPDTPYENTTFDLMNLNKRSIAVDLKKPEGKEILMKLLADADVFMTNWRPQALKKQGLDYETLHAKFPKLITASLSGYGEKGPDAALPGYDSTAFFTRSGFIEALRQRDGLPINIAPGIGDHVTGLGLTAGILMAYVNAQKTGIGEKVDISLFHTAVYCQGILLQAAQYEDIGLTFPISKREMSNPFNSFFMTKDQRYIQICILPYNLLYSKFITLLGRGDLAEDPRYHTLEAVAKYNTYNEFAQIMEEAFAQKTAAEWTEILTAGDIPFSVAQNWLEVLKDPQAWESDVFYNMHYPTGNDRTIIRTPIHVGNELPELERAPYLGEQSIEVLGELGYSVEEIAQMHANGVFVNWDDVKEKHKG